jgi:hypothetical protein
MKRLLPLVLACGCPGGDDGSGGTGSVTSGPGTADSSGSDEGSGSGSGSASTGGTPLSCDEATSESACLSAGGDFSDCGWFATRAWVLDGEGQCMDLMIEAGRCLETAREDSGCPGEFPAICPDGNTTVFYREAGLELGAIELLAHSLDGSCDGPGGDFTPCGLDGNGDPDPPECLCACPTL